MPSEERAQAVAYAQQRIAKAAPTGGSPIPEKEDNTMKNSELLTLAARISSGGWHGITEGFHPDDLAAGTELFCHAALLAQDTAQALEFTDALCERLCSGIAPDFKALLLHTRSRLESVNRRGGWLPTQISFRKPRNITNSFPTDVFPSYIERFCDSVAVNVQVDRAMICAAVLAASALCMQGRFQVGYPSGNGHAEHLCLYLVIVASPGERKSSVFAKALSPIRAWQESKRDSYRTELASYRARQEAIHAEIESVKQKLHKASGADRVALGDDLTSLYLDENALQLPASPELIAMDTTTEALASLLELTGGSAGIFTDESDFFKIIAGLYNRGQASNLGLVLKAYDGSPFHRTRRQETVVLERPLLSMCLFAQPVLFEQMQGNPELQGRGMVGRLLFCQPERMAGRRDVTVSDPIDSQAEEMYRELLGDFLEMGQLPDAQIHRLGWEPQAAALMLKYLQMIENSMQAGHSMEQAADYASKAGGAAIRMAGILHLMHSRGESMAIPVEIAEKAIRLHKYFFGEKVRELDAEENIEDKLLEKVRAKIEELTIDRGLAYVSVSAVHQRLRGTREFSDAGEFWRHLRILEGQNLIEIVAEGKNKKTLYVSPSWECTEEKPSA